MASLFGKMRKDAKEKNKVNKGQDASATEQFTKQDVAEIEPVTEAELNVLLASLNIEEDVVPVEEVAAAEEVPTTTADKVFRAFGVYYDKKKRKFVKVSIDYCVATCYTNLVSTEDFTDSQAVAVMKMSQALSLKLIRNEEVL